MSDVAQQSGGKSEIQGNWSEGEIAALKEENLRLREDKRLADALCGLLSSHCGETGENEGAVDTLKRLLTELKAGRQGPQPMAPTAQSVEMARGVAADIEENEMVSEEAVAKHRANAARFIPPLSLPQHQEILNGFSPSVYGAASREAYMRRHGLVYVEGVLHWEKDQRSAAEAWVGPWPRPLGYSREDWAKWDEEGRGLIWLMRMTGGAMCMSEVRPLPEKDLELRQYVAWEMERVKGLTHFGTYLSQTDCERQISDFQGLKVERLNWELVTCPECKAR